MTQDLKHRERINLYCDWMAEQVSALTKAASEATEEEAGYAKISWEDLTMRFHYQDILSTAALITSRYKEQNAQCGLSGIMDQLNSPREIGIDYFFYRCHVLAHVIITELRPDLDTGDLPEVSFIETTCNFVAAIICRHYYGIPKLSCEMAFEIFACLSDQVELDKEIGEVYTSRDRIDLCRVVVDKIIDNDMSFLN
jgi:hypothetical protein